MTEDDHMVLLDASYFVYRSYFRGKNENPAFAYRSDGLPIAGVRAFFDSLFWLMHRPHPKIGAFSHIAAVFDGPRRNWRHDIMPAYKMSRPESEPDLRIQKPLMREAAVALGLQPVVVEGFESDDVITSYAVAAEQAGARVTIVTEDKDLMQVVSDRVRIFSFAKGLEGYQGYVPEKSIGPDEVMAKFGVPPHLVPDAQGIMGDSSDGIPGIPGLGAKAATDLICQFGSLENVLDSSTLIMPAKRRNLVELHAASARMSKELATMRRDVPLPIALDDCIAPPIEPYRAAGFCKAMELKTEARKVCEAFRIDPDDVEPWRAYAEEESEETQAPPPPPEPQRRGGMWD